MSTSTTNSTEKKIIDGVLSLITLTDTTIPKLSVYSDQTDQGTGVITAEVTNWEQVTPGLPDYTVSVSVSGRTLESEDPNKNIIRVLFDDCRRSLAAFSPSGVATATNLSCVGILKQTAASVKSTGADSIFSIDFQLVFTNIQF